MAKIKKSVNEYVSWGVNSKAPIYKIGLAPNYVLNADEKLKHDYFQQKAEENETLYQKLKLVGDLDKLKPVIERVFMDLTNMRNALQVSHDDIVVTEEQKITIKNIQKELDTFNNTLLTKIVPMLDELGMEEGYYASNTKD